MRPESALQDAACRYLISSGNRVEIKEYRRDRVKGKEREQIKTGSTFQVGLVEIEHIKPTGAN